MMAFRVGGALESVQEQYFLLNLCFSMVTFDLQAQVFVQTSVPVCTVILLGIVLSLYVFSSQKDSSRVPHPNNLSQAPSENPFSCAPGKLMWYVIYKQEQESEFFWLSQVCCSTMRTQVY